LPKQLQRAEQDFVNATERYGNELRRALIQKLSELPTAGFAELIATWLNAEGITALRAVRRPGSSSNELHFAGTRKTGSEELRLAIVVLRGGRDIDREGVIDVRGALHHYGQASAAWIVTTGRSTSGGREEGAAQGAAPVALFDGMALATAMERLGIAVRRHVVAHHELDYDLFESLGDTPEQRERREREQRTAQLARHEGRGHEQRQRQPAAELEPRESSEAETRTNLVASIAPEASRLIVDEVEEVWDEGAEDEEVAADAAELETEDEESEVDDEGDVEIDESEESEGDVEEVDEGEGDLDVDDVESGDDGESDDVDEADEDEDVDDSDDDIDPDDDGEDDKRRG
jgi:hypothetical protein